MMTLNHWAWCWTGIDHWPAELSSAKGWRNGVKGSFTQDSSCPGPSCIRSGLNVKASSCKCHVTCPSCAWLQHRRWQRTYDLHTPWPWVKQLARLLGCFCKNLLPNIAVVRKQNIHTKSTRLTKIDKYPTLLRIETPPSPPKGRSTKPLAPLSHSTPRQKNQRKWFHRTALPNLNDVELNS